MFSIDILGIATNSTIRWKVHGLAVSSKSTGEKEFFFRGKYVQDALPLEWYTRDKLPCRKTRNEFIYGIKKSTRFHARKVSCDRKFSEKSSLGEKLLQIHWKIPPKITPRIMEISDRFLGILLMPTPNENK